MKFWQRDSLMVKILRAWLGITFLYAGVEKIRSVGFLDVTAPDYIGAQLKNFGTGSPLKSVIPLMVEHATLVGIGSIVTEIAIGLATLFGFAPFVTALAGAGFSLTLWLTSSWNVSPYFLGSDTAYLVMWLALAAARKPARLDFSMERRSTIRLGILAALTLIVGSAAQLTKPAKQASGKILANRRRVKKGNVVEFTATNGNPAYLYHKKNGTFIAYSAVCTHQGCQVLFDQPSKEMRCPCHGAVFDSEQNGAVVRGPAPAPLAQIKIKVSGDNITQA